MTQLPSPPNSGQPAPVIGVTGGPGLPQGVASIEGGTGNVVIAPPSNTIQYRKGAIPQSLQVYEYFNSNTDNVRIALATTTNGPEFIGVQANPANVIRNLVVGTTGDLIFSSANANRWVVLGTNGWLVPVTDNTVQIGEFGGRRPQAIFTNQLYVASAFMGLGSNQLWLATGIPNNANGTNGDIYFNITGGALTTIYQKRAGVWVGIV